MDNAAAATIAKTHNVGALRVTATYGTETSDPQRITFGVRFLTDADRDAFVALFPKSAKFRSTFLSTYDNGDFRTGNSIRLPYVDGDIVLHSNGANGGVNETGIKRYHSIMKAAAKAGVEVEYLKPFTNSYESLTDLDAALA